MKLSAQKILGFTLIELMVAVSIVAILGAIGAVVYSSGQKTARISKRLQDIQAISAALELYKTSTGKYPLLASGAAASGCITTLSLSPAITPTYMSTLPSDPSSASNCYYYRSDDGFDYKIRTNVIDADMVANDYNQQPTFVDPRRDGGTGYTDTTCGAPPSPAVPTAWAIYTNGGRCW